MKASLLIASFMALANSKMFTMDLTTRHIEGTAEPHIVEILQHDMLRITLPERPSTGYQWMYLKPEMKNGPESVYSLVKDEYIKTSESNGAEVVGAGGKRYIILEGDKVGEDTFEAVLVKPWLFDGEYSEDSGVAYHKIILRILPNPDFEEDSFLY